MRSLSEGTRGVATATVLMIALVTLAAAPVQQESAEWKAGTPGRAEIERALDNVKADPNFANERTIKTLRWKESRETNRSSTPAWLMWLIGLFRWIEQSARVLVWGAAIVLAGMLAVYIVRTLRSPGMSPRGREDSFVAPTHVRDLDIRPETLPPNIGAAARALWNRGNHRAALALLYRGMLSRLAHLHGVPIRDSSTEGDCLAAAAARLPRSTCEYLSRLVRVWQRFGYGHENVPDATVHELCDEFAAVLDGAPAAEAIPRRGAA